MLNLFNRTYAPIGRAIVAVAAGILLLLSSPAPAQAFGGSSSSPTKGAAELNTLQEQSEDVLESEPRSQGEVKAEAKKGLNDVQADANAEKMNTPADSMSAVTVREQVEDALKDITPNR